MLKKGPQIEENKKKFPKCYTIANCFVYLSAYRYNVTKMKIYV